MGEVLRYRGSVAQGPAQLLPDFIQITAIREGVVTQVQVHIGAT